MKIRLILLNEPQPEGSYELADGKNTVGRNKSNKIAIRHDSVSRAHAEILAWGPEVIIRDLGSRNGTWIGARQLKSSQAPVKFGETIRFGSVLARLEANPQVVGRLSLDDAMEDMTAVRHYSQAMRSRPGMNEEPLVVHPPRTKAVLMMACEESPDCNEQTLIVVRSNDLAGTVLSRCG